MKTNEAKPTVKEAIASTAPRTTKLYEFPTNITMKNIGDSIQGLYLGRQVKKGEGFNGGDLVLAVFKQPDDKLTTCVCGSQVVKFLEGFNKGYFLKITRTKTTKLKDDRKFAEYAFECDEAGLKPENVTELI